MAESIADFPRIWSQLSKRFRCDPNSIHGPSHWRRVEENGLILAEETAGAAILVVRLFAVFHDSQRLNDWLDPDHGPRAAKVAKKKMGEWFEVSHDQLELLLFACRHHTDGTTSDDPTIGCCWDADRLDLPRVHILPHPDFMSTSAGQRLAAEQSDEL